MDWIEVRGTVKRGHGIASGIAADSPYPGGSIELQAPFFKKLGLDLSPFYLATLNIDISPVSFTIENPAYAFRGVDWIEVIPPEDFSFSRCEIAFRDAWYPALVYYPHPETKLRHFQDDSTVEIISQWIEGIGYGDQVSLRLNPGEIGLENLPV